MVDSLSEFPLFLFSGYILTWFGFVPCFCISFCTYIIRFISYSFLGKSLYWVLLVETVHCFSFTLYIAAGTGYADSITTPGLVATLQSVFQGVFFGLGLLISVMKIPPIFHAHFQFVGIGAGNLVGGFLYPVIGPRWLFRGSAVVAAICAVSYALIYYSGILNDEQRSRRSSAKYDISTIGESSASTSRRPFGAAMNMKEIDQETVTLRESFDDISTIQNFILDTPKTKTTLYRAPDGLYRSPGADRVPMVIMMTPLTARILAKDGAVKFIDDEEDDDDWVNS